MFIPQQPGQFLQSRNAYNICNIILPLKSRCSASASYNALWIVQNTLAHAYSLRMYGMHHLGLILDSASLLVLPLVSACQDAFVADLLTGVSPGTL
jgi:hypothetical protein